MLPFVLSVSKRMFSLGLLDVTTLNSSSPPAVKCICNSKSLIANLYMKALLFQLLPVAYAISASVFILPLGQNSPNYTFALSIPENSTDIYFHLSGPADYSWIAVGTGSNMKNSLMVLLYAAANGKSPLTSPYGKRFSLANVAMQTLPLALVSAPVIKSRFIRLH